MPYPPFGLLCCYSKPFLSLQSLSTKSLSCPNDHQKMRAKMGAKPFDSCQLHWTKLDKIFVTLALQLHEASSQYGWKSTFRGSNPLAKTLCELSLNIWRQFISIYQEYSYSFQGSFAFSSILYLQPALLRPNCKCDLPSKFVLLLQVEETYFTQRQVGHFDRR